RLLQRILAPAGWRGTDAEQQFGKRDAGKVKGFGRLLIQPRQHGGVRRGFHRLGNDIGIQDDHSKLTGSVGVLSRTFSMAAMSSSVSPTRRPSSARAEPKRSRSGGRTVDS